MTLRDAIDAAWQADEDFEAAIQSAHARRRPVNRWEVDTRATPALVVAYDRKLAADHAMHAAFERARKWGGLGHEDRWSTRL